MEVFNYEVVDSLGNIIKGSIDAEHQIQATQRLKDKGYMIIEIESLEKTSNFTSFFSRGKRVTSADKVLFSRQLAAMLNAGIPVTQALFTLCKQVENLVFRDVLEDITKNVESGMSLYDAFSLHPVIFNDLYLGMIQAGEVGGNLGETLTRLANQMQKDKVLKDNIRSATIYPISVASFSLVILFVMLVFIVPIFEGFFPENIDIPFISKVVITLSYSIRTYWHLWLFIPLLLISVVYIYTKTATGSIMMEKLRFKIPAFGSLFYKTEIARFSRTFSTLLSNGIPVIQALETSGKATGSKLFLQAVQDSIAAIEEGKNIGETFEESDFFPPIVSHMITVGEETGALPSLLNKVAEFYEDEVTAISKTITSLIEPILLVLVGVVVGGMLVALYSPIFTVITQTNL